VALFELDGSVGRVPVPGIVSSEDEQPSVANAKHSLKPIHSRAAAKPPPFFWLGVGVRRELECAPDG
jgi:hypothetical protein